MNRENKKTILFNFELNQIQTSIILIFCLIGVFLIPIFLAADIFVNLAQRLFVHLPYYFSNPEHLTESSIFSLIAPPLIRIAIFGVFLYLSVYSLKKILRNEYTTEYSKLKIIPQERIVNWFGFKLSHGQALFIFSLSIMGIIFIIEQIVEFYADFFNTFENVMCIIPSGEYSAGAHQVLLDNIPIALYSLYILLCLYSILATRRRSVKVAHSNKIANGYAIIIFIVSLIIFSLYLIRLFCHLFMFTNFAYIIGIMPEPTNKYQISDLINVCVILLVSLTIMGLTHYLKKKPKEFTHENKQITWFHFRLTDQRVILLLSYTLLNFVFFSYIFTYFFFGISPGIFTLFDIMLLIIIIIIIITYTLNKLTKNDLTKVAIRNINNSVKIENKWFKYRIGPLYSIIFFSVSSGSIFLYIFQMVAVNFYFRSMILIPESFSSYNIFFVSLVLMLASLGFLLILGLYTIKHTINAIKSR